MTLGEWKRSQDQFLKEFVELVKQTYEVKKEKENMSYIKWKIDDYTVYNDGDRFSEPILQANLIGTVTNVGAYRSRTLREVLQEFEDRLNSDNRPRVNYSGYSKGIAKPYVDPMDIKDVIFNPPATIVFWADGTKTVVKAQNGEPFDPEKGLAMAITKRIYGDKGRYFEVIKKWVGPYNRKNEEE